MTHIKNSQHPLFFLFSNSCINIQFKKKYKKIFKKKDKKKI